MGRKSRQRKQQQRDLQKLKKRKPRIDKVTYIKHNWTTLEKDTKETIEISALCECYNLNVDTLHKLTAKAVAIPGFSSKDSVLLGLVLAKLSPELQKLFIKRYNTLGYLKISLFKSCITFGYSINLSRSCVNYTPISFKKLLEKFLDLKKKVLLVRKEADFLEMDRETLVISALIMCVDQSLGAIYDKM